jgi:acetyl esterase
LRWAYDAAQTGCWDAQRLAVGGESAGANLAAVCAQQWRGLGRPALRLQLLICPLTDFRGRDWPSRRRFANSIVLPARSLSWLERAYLPDHRDRLDPRASPLAALDLTGLAPAHVITAELDPLLDEGRAYAHAMAEAGVAVTLKSYPSVHGLVGLHERLAQGRRALGSCIAALRLAIA